MSQRQLDPRQVNAQDLPDGLYAFTVVGGVVTGLALASTSGGGTDIPVVSVLPDPSESELNDLVVWVP